MHPTPLRVDKIGAILKTGIRSNPFPIYTCGAGDGQGVGQRTRDALTTDKAVKGWHAV